MKLEGGPDQWRARLGALTEAEGPSGTTGPQRARLTAAEDLYADAIQLSSAPRATESFLNAARRVWDARGQAGMPKLAARLADEGVPAVREELLSASKAELTELVDALALICLGATDGAAPLDRLLDLKAVLAAGQDVAKAYRQQRKSAPAAQRVGEELDPRWTDILATLEARLEEVARAERLATFAEGLGRASTKTSRWARKAHLDGAAGTAGAIAAGMYGAGGKVVDTVRSTFGGGEGEVQVPGWIRAVGRRAKGLLDKVLPAPVRTALDDLTSGAKGLVRALYEVEDDAEDADALVGRFADALETAKPLVDPSADAVGVGVLKEAAVLLNGARGQELVYNRRTKQLQLNALDLVGARLGLGATVRAYCRNLYGDGEAIAKSEGRSGLEVGALVGHAGFYTAKVPEGYEAPRGWMSTVSLGYTLSLPMISDQSLFAIKETPTVTYDLDPAQVSKIEEVLEGIPRSAATYTDALGEAVKQPDDA